MMRIRTARTSGVFTDARCSGSECPLWSLRLRARVPKPRGHAETLKTLGEHLKKKRMDLDLLQRVSSGIHDGVCPGIQPPRLGRQKPAEGGSEFAAPGPRNDSALGIEVAVPIGAALHPTASACVSHERAASKDDTGQILSLIG